MADENRDWRENNDERREVTRERRSRTNWWPLLFLPVAFVIGWVGGDAADNTSRDQAYTNQTQPGIGGGPDVTVPPAPSQTFTVTPLPTQEVSISPLPSIGQ